MVGLLSIPWTIIAELFPIEIRGVAHSIVYSIANVIMFIAIQSYYNLNRLFGGSSGLQYFFAIVSLGGLIYSYVFLPETHKKKLSEIENYFIHHTTYLSYKAANSKKNDVVVEQSMNRKPIVRNSRLSQTDYNMKTINEQGEKMLQEKV